MKDRLMGFGFGLVYAVVYGFFTMFITGGGHGNFLWLMLFVFSYFFGLFFPISGFLIADLRPNWARVALGLLLVLHLVALWWYFGPVVTDLLANSQEGPADDVIKSWEKSPVAFIFFAIVHLIPLIFVSTLSFKNLFSNNKTHIIFFKQKDKKVESESYLGLR